MNWDAIGAIAEMLGALAVFFTLTFLAFQVRQAKEGLQASAHQSYSHDKRELTMFLASADIRGPFIRGLIDPRALDEDGRYVFHQAMATFMFWSQTSFQMWSKGQISDGDWRTEFQLLQELHSSEGFSVWWPACKYFYEADFIEIVESVQPTSDMGYERFIKSLDSA